MGLRGPAPTPTKILQKRGSWLANTRPDEPDIAPSKPTKPEGLSEEAAKEFDRIADILNGVRVLTQADRAALTQYAYWWAEFLESMSDPQAASDASSHLLKWAQQLGLTPASRARVKSIEAPKEQGKDRFFGPRLAG